MCSDWWQTSLNGWGRTWKQLRLLSHPSLMGFWSWAFCYIITSLDAWSVTIPHSTAINRNQTLRSRIIRLLMIIGTIRSSHFVYFRLIVLIFDHFWSFLIIFDHFWSFLIIFVYSMQQGTWFRPIPLSIPCPFVPGAVSAVNLTGSRWKDLLETMPRREAMGQLSGESPEA